MSGALRPDKRRLRVSCGDEALVGTATSRDETGEVERAELHVGHRNIEGPKFGGEDFRESGQGRANGSLRRMKWRVDRGNDRGSKDKNLGRNPFFSDGVQAGCE